VSKRVNIACCQQQQQHESSSVTESHASALQPADSSDVVVQLNTDVVSDDVVSDSDVIVVDHVQQTSVKS